MGVALSKSSIHRCIARRLGGMVLLSCGPASTLVYPRGGRSISQAAQLPRTNSTSVPSDMACQWIIARPIAISLARVAMSRLRSCIILSLSSKFRSES